MDSSTDLSNEHMVEVAYKSEDLEQLITEKENELAELIALRSKVILSVKGRDLPDFVEGGYIHFTLKGKYIGCTSEQYCPTDNITDYKSDIHRVIPQIVNHEKLIVDYHRRSVGHTPAFFCLKVTDLPIVNEIHYAGPNCSQQVNTKYCSSCQDRICEQCGKVGGYEYVKDRNTIHSICTQCGHKEIEAMID